MLLLILLVRYLLLSRNNTPGAVFAEALRNENSGDYEAALTNYETAMLEVKKARFPNSKLKTIIAEKLKVLRTVIEYQKNFN